MDNDRFVNMKMEVKRNDTFEIKVLLKEFMKKYYSKMSGKFCLIACEKGIANMRNLYENVMINEIIREKESKIVVNPLETIRKDEEKRVTFAPEATEVDDIKSIEGFDDEKKVVVMDEGEKKVDGDMDDVHDEGEKRDDEEIIPEMRDDEHEEKEEHTTDEKVVDDKEKKGIVDKTEAVEHFDDDKSVSGDFSDLFGDETEEKSTGVDHKDDIPEEITKVDAPEEPPKIVDDDTTSKVETPETTPKDDKIDTMSVTTHFDDAPEISSKDETPESPSKDTTSEPPSKDSTPEPSKTDTDEPSTETSSKPEPSETITHDDKTDDLTATTHFDADDTTETTASSKYIKIPDNIITIVLDEIPKGKPEYNPVDRFNKAGYININKIVASKDMCKALFDAYNTDIDPNSSLNNTNSIYKKQECFISIIIPVIKVVLNGKNIMNASDEKALRDFIEPYV